MNKETDKSKFVKVISKNKKYSLECSLTVLLDLK